MKLELVRDRPVLSTIITLRSFRKVHGIYYLDLTDNATIGTFEFRRAMVKELDTINGFIFFKPSVSFSPMATFIEEIVEDGEVINKVKYRDVLVFRWRKTVLTIVPMSIALKVSDSKNKVLWERK